MIIGISGKSGSGKSSVSNYLAKRLNCKWIDVDKLSESIRDLYKEEIVRLVKDNKIIKDRKIDSKLLGDILFSNKELMDEYNKFIYQKQKEIIEKEIKESKDLIVDSMFLTIMDVYKVCDYKILVKCEDYLRKVRIIKRDNISEEYFKKREQFSLDYKESDFDYIIDNNGDYKGQVDKFLANKA